MQHKHKMLIVAGAAATAIIALGVAGMALILKSPRNAGQDDTPEQERVAITARCERHLIKSKDVVKDPVLAFAFTDACQALRLSTAGHQVNREIGQEMITQIKADGGPKAEYLAQLRPNK